MHWSEPHIAFLRSTVPEIHETPVYLLRVDESEIEWHEHWLACFSALGDLKNQATLEALGLWAGRGVSVAVRDDFGTWSTRCQNGILLHEMAHALEYIRGGDAFPAELCPVSREMFDGVESEILREAGIDQKSLLRMQHGPGFVRLSMHLLWRARSELPLSPADLQFLHSTYSLPESKYEAVAAALAPELAASRNLNLTRLREAPVAFTELFP